MRRCRNSRCQSCRICRYALVRWPSLSSSDGFFPTCRYYADCMTRGLFNRNHRTVEAHHYVPWNPFSPTSRPDPTLMGDADRPLCSPHGNEIFLARPGWETTRILRWLAPPHVTLFTDLRTYAISLRTWLINGYPIRGMRAVSSAKAPAIPHRTSVASGEIAYILAISKSVPMAVHIPLMGIKPEYDCVVMVPVQKRDSA